MDGVRSQPAKSLIRMTSEQDTQSSGIRWNARHSDTGANRPAAFPGEGGHNHFKDKAKEHRYYRRASGVTAPTRPLPPIPAPADNDQPVRKLRPLPKIPGQTPAVNTRPIMRSRPLPVIPGRRVQGPRPNRKIRR